MAADGWRAEIKKKKERGASDETRGTDKGGLQYA